MSAIAAIIAGACINTSGMNKDACQKGLDAGSKQFGVERYVNTVEYNTNKDAVRTSVDLFGKNGTEAIGSTVYFAKIISDKSVSFKMPTMGLADKITTTAGVHLSQLIFEWKF